MDGNHRRNRRIDVGSTTDRRPLLALILATMVLGGGTVLAVAPAIGGAVPAPIEQADDGGFMVTIDGTNSPVVEGETLTVTATVENTASSGGTQEITLEVGEERRDATEITLRAGDSRTVELEWVTSAGDAGEYEAVVASADDADRTDVSVESANEAPTVSADADAVTVEEGSVATMAGTYDDPDGDNGAVALSASVGSVTVVDADRWEWSFDSTDGPDESQPVTITAEDEDGATDETTFELTVENVPPAIELTELTTDGATLTVAADVADAGVDDSHEATIDWGDGTADAIAVEETADGGTLEATHTYEAAGEYPVTLTVTDDDGGEDSVTRTITADEPVGSFYDVTIEETTAPVEAGATLEVTATIENVGDERGDQTVALDVGGEQRDATAVTLEPGASTTVELTWASSTDAVGEHDATVRSDDASDTVGVTVKDGGGEPAYFAVRANTTNDTTHVGGLIGLNIGVENTGDDTGTQEIAILVDGSVVESEELTLDGGASDAVTWETEAGEPGTYDFAVRSDDDEAAVTVEVREAEPAAFDVQIVAVDGPVTAGEALEVEAAVTNTGSDADEQQIDLLVDEEIRDSMTLALGAGEETTLMLTWETPDDAAGEHAIAVASDDTEDTTGVAVEASSGSLLPLPVLVGGGLGGVALAAGSYYYVRRRGAGEISGGGDGGDGGPDDMTAEMNKAELIDSIASEADLSGGDATKGVDAFIDTTTKALKKGTRVSLVGFGSFNVSKRSARKGRNPQTGKESTKSSKKNVKFTPSTDLAATVAGSGAPSVQKEMPAADKKGIDKQRAEGKGTDKKGIDKEKRAAGPSEAAGEQSSQGGSDPEPEADVRVDPATIASEAALSTAEAKKALDAFIDTTTKALTSSKSVNMGEAFGTFEVVEEPPRTDRLNLDTGVEEAADAAAEGGPGDADPETETAYAKKVVKFKPGAELSNKVE